MTTEEGQTLGGLGEFGLIAAVTARMPQGDGVLLGPGDDAAIVAAPDRRVVVSTDLLVQDRHFRLDWSSGYDIGRKAAAASLADIAAMGAAPTALLLGLAAPPHLGARWAGDLADGLREECAVVGASVVGGDVVRADAVLLAVTALGDLQGRRPLTRAGARATDVVAVRGRLGWAAGGLALLLAGRGDEHPAVAAAHRRPRPPYAAGPQAAELGASALIDVSDGLLADLGHVARASGVRVEIHAEALIPAPEPAAAAVALGVSAREWALTGGDDHALVGAFPAGADLPADWTAIGVVTDGSGVTVDGAPWPGAAGWDHYR